MQSACSVGGPDVIVVRLGWFFHSRLKGCAEKISGQTGIARGTLRRYMDFDPERIASGTSGPQKIPHVLRILDALEVNPAKLAAALYYAEDEATFRRLMSASLCIEEKLAVQVGGQGRPKLNPRVIRLEPEDCDDGAGGTSRPACGRMRARFQERLAWYVRERIRGRHDEIYARTGILPATQRRYGEIEGAAEGRTGPQKIRTFLKLLEALQVSPAKLAVAAHYSGDDDSFWAIMSSTICVEERLNFRGPDGQPRLRRHLHRLDDSPGLVSQFPLTASGGEEELKDDG